MEQPLRETPAVDVGYRRIGVSAPALRVADVDYNVAAMEEVLERAAEAGCALVVFPELGLTAYSCGDLFLTRTLLDAAMEGLRRVERAVARTRVAAICGMPWEVEGRLYNAAVVVGPEGVAGWTPKGSLPNGQEYYEKRWFAAGWRGMPGEVEWDGRRVPCGLDLLYDLGGTPELVVGIEVCEDLWTVTPPSGKLALAGAVLICNPSASVEWLGKAEYRRDLVRLQSARCLAAYAYAGAGPGESSAEAVFSGATMLYENGKVVVEGERFSFASTLAVAEVDVDLLRLERMRNTGFSAARVEEVFRRVVVAGVRGDAGKPLARQIDAHPFVPTHHGSRNARCREIFAIQSKGLEKRLLHTGLRRVVLGISGGLDSTLALLVCVAAFDAHGWERAEILAVTMPGLGTTARTRSNATRLAELLGVGFREIPIEAAVLQHFADIGQAPDRHDVTFENAQARERTQILMDLANQTGGLVVGTGDLSESALGWCTFSGDHLSMYHVNSGVPKTLVRYLIEWAAETLFEGQAAEVLRDVCATPVSPELLPAAADGTLAQRTEEVVGPYELHDFFLYHFVRHGLGWEKIAVLAALAFAGRYADEEIRRWLAEFRRRFFANQFKRNSMPDGPKVGSVALSPRSDWRMPSDARFPG